MRRAAKRFPVSPTGRRLQRGYPPAEFHRETSGGRYGSAFYRMYTAGIHHITAIASDPLRNVAFYSEVLGLRLVKRTVNFDDPASYHLYFGDNIGTSGSILTFFSWPDASRGAAGSTEVAAISFAVPPDAIDFWKERLAAHRVSAEEIAPRLGEAVVRFRDPDGLSLEFVAPADPLAVEPWNGGAIPMEQAIRGFAAPTLAVRRADLTERVLAQILGFRFTMEEGNRRRFEAGESSAAARVDVVSSDAAPARIAVGSVHHIAVRAADDEEQLRWRDEWIGVGFHVSPVMDRNYFHSIYFREPSGILFEIATDGPGFAIDEPLEALGTSLKLPPAFEPMRAEIERVLPPLERAAAA